MKIKHCRELIITLISLTFFISCDYGTKKIAKSEISDKEYDFGEISISDSIVHSFFIKNSSTTPLKIYEVASSCGCTTTNFTKTNIGLNEHASIQVVFKPDRKGYIEKSIIVETNTDPPFNVFYLKGIVK
ncbi:MAG: DUF1573 domain-containing protein [Flavobacteriaceae bacterium]|nr:DUF1573 domain-containing protein [Flavobacteriaceae bacterium]